MTKSHRNVAIRFIRTATDRELLDELDDLVADAVAGDRHAIGAIAVAFGPMLLKEARKVLGPLFAQDDADVLQDLCHAMTERTLIFPLIRGGAIPWMKRTMRSFAQEHLRKRERDWGLAATEPGHTGGTES